MIRDFSVKEKYSSLSSWVVRISTSFLLVSSVIYFFDITANPVLRKDIPDLWLMDSSQYSSYIKSIMESSEISLSGSLMLINTSIVLFSTTFIISFSILFILFIIRKDLFPAVTVLLIVIVQSTAALRTFF